MPTPTPTTAVEAYFTALRQVRASGGATGERSLYTPLANLLDAIGATLKPKVFCVQEPANQGAGHPDFGLYTARQVQKGRPRQGQAPERGVIEVKPHHDDAWLTASSAQVSRYWSRYRLVLVTNCRDFVLLGEDAATTTDAPTTTAAARPPLAATTDTPATPTPATTTARPARLECLRLAPDAATFARRLEHPRAFARAVGPGLAEYLSRALSHRAVLAEPRDLAWLLASYARDALARVEAADQVPALALLRSALEDALGVRFRGPAGARFFRSTLVQTLFYGVFSAWVLWARQTPAPAAAFDWRAAVWHLRAPVLAALFQQLSQPGRLRPLGLVEVLDWTAAALARVDRAAFFSRFDRGQAVPYFYEPFLEAFDPELRKQLGVWYTPAEVVRYMVARVDRALKDDLAIPAGLAARNVYVLDPCCGTGAYLAEVLRRIAANLQGQGLGALAGARVRQAALERVFGFEIMPAPFVVAHLQVGLAMQALDAPLAADGAERAAIFLTNALTGWEPRATKPLPFPELEEERDRAERVKREAPVLVILGNPPYNGFAGLAVEEERALSDAYRTARRVRRPEGQGLNDLYVRFFRMAERRIAEKTGRGIVCFISNYSWLDGLSFTGMRERYLEAFDAVRIDCLNGDKYRTGKLAPDGAPDPSVFSTEGDPVGIQVGTAIATLVRKADHAPARAVGFRHLWGRSKRADLLATADVEPGALYESVAPALPLGLPFVPAAVSEGWFDWPALPDLFPASFPGVKSGRDPFVVDIDIDRLKARIAEYFDPALSHEEIARRYPSAMRNPREYDAREIRTQLIGNGGPEDSRFIRYAFRPFDNRWIYWEAREKLVDRPRPDYRPHVFEGNVWLVTQQKPRREWSPPQVIAHMGCLDLIDRGATCFPVWLRDDGESTGRRPNLTRAARRYLERLGAGVEDLFHHALATLHDPAWRRANAGALRMEWPRIPLPGWPAGGDAEAAAALRRQAQRGRRLAALLDPETPVPGITEAPLHPQAAIIAVPATTDGRNMMGADFALTAGWGHAGAAGAVMPGQGRAVERPFTPQERTALAAALPTLGETTFDIHLNAHALWRNLPAAVWHYKLGGYQVLKKYLSYREHQILNRPLTPEEVQHFTNTARRLAEMVQLAGILDPGR